MALALESGKPGLAATDILTLARKRRRGVADVATSRRRVELQLAQLQQSAAKLQGQAQQALAAGREDLAREALTRRAAVTSQIGDLQGQQASLQAEQDKLTVASQRLQAKVEAFRTRKETIKATYTAAEAETSISEAVTGISEEMGDVGMAVQRAQDKTEQLQARAGGWMSCWPPARCRTPPCPAAATRSRPSWTPSPPATTWMTSWPG